MKLRKYYKVDRKGRLTSEQHVYQLRPDQVTELNKQLKQGERLMRHLPAQPTP